MQLRLPLLILMVLLVFTAVPRAASRIDMGQSFPEVPLPQPESVAQQKYLGLEPGQNFTLSQVRGQVVLVEMLNVLCPHCQKQTLPYNNLYDMIQKDPQTRGRIVMLGVAVGNSDEQIEDFVDIYAVDFPVVSDRSFKLHMAVGGGPTPFSIYLRKEAGEPGVVAGTHLGEDKDMEDLFVYLKETLDLPVSEFASLPQDEAGERTDVEAFLPPDLMAQRLRESFSALGELNDFAALKLDSGRRVYRALVDGKPLFAEVLARSAICDVCHNVHFYYLFDRSGKVLAFEPLHLTRYGNVEWTAEEAQKMRRRVVGGYISKPWAFDPEVDAVSRATMTSAIIFNSLDQGTSLLEELERMKLLNMESK